MPRQMAFARQTHYYLKIMDEGNNKFLDMMRAEKWDKVKLLAPDNHLMAEAYHGVLMSALDSCFSLEESSAKEQ